MDRTLVIIYYIIKVSENKILVKRKLYMLIIFLSLIYFILANHYSKNFLESWRNFLDKPKELLYNISVKKR